MYKFCVLLLILVCHGALAEIQLPKLINQHMVLQRDVDLPIWGYADEGEAVLIKLDGKPIAKTQTSKGKWNITMPPQKAGGPHTLEFLGKNSIKVSDIYFGDVWVASGQSNMELQMYRLEEDYPQDLLDADYPLIRFFMVPQEYNFNAPQDDFSRGEWRLTSAANIKQTPALAFYFAKALLQTNGVAIGIINNALGGSPIEAWMSEEALHAFPESLAEGQRFKNPQLIESINAKDKAKNDAWYGNINQQDLGLNGEKPWFAPNLDESDWETFTVPGYREDTDEHPFNGVWWFRKTVTMNEQQARATNIIRLGRIVDADEVYINGVKVGNTTYQYPPRRYPIPAGLLKEGDNQITVRVIANSGRSGFLFDKPYWIGTDGNALDLKGQWKVKTGTLAPALASDAFIRWKPLGLYNGLTAPLTHFAIKGVIWYQGESNAGRWQDYQAKFSTMIKDWRKAWGQGDFPFIFAQLANYMPQKTQPSDTDWAQLRHAQSQTLSEPNTAIALAIDIGEWNDIHPTNKKTLAHRMALAARALALHEDIRYQGPEISQIQRIGQTLVLSFTHIADGLVLKSQNDHSFAIANDDGQFSWADAQLQGNQIILSAPNIKQPSQVRYAWGDNPDASLYNSEQLPALPFAKSL